MPPDRHHSLRSASVTGLRFRQRLSGGAKEPHRHAADPKVSILAQHGPNPQNVIQGSELSEAHLQERLPSQELQFCSKLFLHREQSKPSMPADQT